MTDVPMLTEEEELERSQDAYRVADWHDARAEQQASRWFLVAVLMIVTNVGLLVYHHLSPREIVSAFVQVIRQSDDGQVILVDSVKPLREYVVPPESIMFMLSRFVIDLRRLGSDPVDTLGRQQNVDAAACGPAAKLVTLPNVREAALVAVNIESVMPTDSPQTYRAAWRESWHDARGYPKGEHRFLGDFSLARRDLDFSKRDSMDIFIRNPLSLCVKAFTVHEVP